MLTNAVAPDKSGGLERYVRELSAGLVGAGERVEVLAKRIDRGYLRDEIGLDGVRIRRYDVALHSSVFFAPTYPFRTASAVRRVARRSGGAVLHAHFPIPALPLALERRPYLYTFHAPVYRELLSERQDGYPLARPFRPAAVEGLRRAERLVVRRAAGIVVLSEFMRSELERLDPQAAARAELVPGGVDTARFVPGEASRDAWAADADPALFTARRLTPRTGIRELLEAMPAILGSLPHARLAVAGAGRSEGELRAQASRLGLDGAVRFLGRVSDDDLVAGYRSADLVLMPTQALEGFGRTTAEALACGTPVLGTPVGANPELLRPIDPVLVSRDASPRGIADAVCELFNDPDRLETIRDRLAPAAAALAWERIVPAYLAAYERLAGAR